MATSTQALLQEVFLESDWEDVAQARAARDQRANQLQAQGLICSFEDLFRATDGRRVFLLKAIPPQSIEVNDSPRPQPNSRPSPKANAEPRKRRPQTFEER